MRGNWGDKDMTPQKSQSLGQGEAQTKATTIAKHREELSLIQKMLDHYLAGFNRIGTFTISDNNKLEYVWLLLITRSFNSLRCAFDILQKGYYSQAMMLIRSVFEDWLTAKDCEKNQKTLDAFLQGENELGKGEFRFSEMAKRISDEFYNKVWRNNYGQESQIAHARQMALKILVDPDTNELSLGGHYDDVLFVATCHALLRAAVIMIDFLAKLLGNKATQWQTETLPTINAASAYIERVSDKAKRLSEE